MRVSILSASFLALTLAATPGVGRPDDKTPRQQLEELFKQQVKSNTAVRSPAGSKLFIDKDGKGGPAGNGGNGAGANNGEMLGSMARVWAELCDVKTRKPTGKYVSLSKYEWATDEPFLLHFEVSVKAKMHVFNVNHAATGDPPQVLPDNTYPETKLYYRAGTPHQVPFTLKTANKKADELIEIFFTPEKDQPPVNDKALKIYRENLVRRGLNYQPRAFIGEDGPAKTSDKPLDVADYIVAPPKVGPDGSPGDAQGFKFFITLKKQP